MALIKCPECKKSISEHAEMCIGCGCPMRIIESLNGTYASRALGRMLGSILGVPGPVLSQLPGKEYSDVLDHNLSDLDQKERAVLEYRTGLFDTCARTYEEIGLALKIAPSDVYMYEATAYEKLRKIHPIFSVFMVMTHYPQLDDLKEEALHRGYMPIETDEENDVALENAHKTNFAFDRCCIELLDMYHPSSVHVTPINNLRIGVVARMMLEEENINTIGDLIALSKVEVLEIMKGKERRLRAIENELSHVNLALRDDSEE